MRQVRAMSHLSLPPPCISKLEPGASWSVDISLRPVTTCIGLSRWERVSNLLRIDLDTPRSSLIEFRG